MPRLRTDDGPRKLRAVWLGPAGHTLPFQWTYVQWAVTLIAVPVAGTIGTVIVWLLLRDPVWALGIGGLWFSAGGVYLAIRLMRNVSFDEPLSYHRRLVKGEFSSQFSRPVGPHRISVEFAMPSVDYLSPAVLRAMGWDITEQQPLSTRTESTAGVQPLVPANPYLSSAPTTPHDDQGSAAPDQRSTNPYLTSSTR